MADYVGHCKQNEVICCGVTVFCPPESQSTIGDMCKQSCSGNIMNKIKWRGHLLQQGGWDVNCLFTKSGVIFQPSITCCF